MIAGYDCKQVVIKGINCAFFFILKNKVGKYNTALYATVSFKVFYFQFEDNLTNVSS